MSNCEGPLMQPVRTDNYLLPPGTCYLCKAPKRRPDEMVVDCGVMAPTDAGVGYYEEPVVICEACISELGHLIGMAHHADVAATNDEAVALRSELDEAKARATDLEAALAALTRARYTPPEPTLADGPHQTVEGINGPTTAPAYPCGESGCERVFTSEHALGVHAGKAHKEHVHERTF